MADIIQLRGGTAAAWTAANPILAQKELGVETDTKKLKLGDGVTAWSSLAYLQFEAFTDPQIADLIKVIDGSNADTLHTHTLEYHSHNAGIEGEPSITDNGNGTFSVAEANCWFYTDTTQDYTIIKVITGGATLTPTDDVTGYICADRTNSDWVLLNAVSNIDYQRYIPYFKVIKRSGSNNMHFQKMPHEAHGILESAHERDLLCNEYQRATGALDTIAVDSSLNITGNGGIVFVIKRKYTIPAISTATRQFKCVWTGSAWSITSSLNPVINNTQYNGASGMTALTAGYWTINYLYRGIEDQDHLYTVYGTTEYATKELAQASNAIAALPELITSHTLLIGRVIVQKDATTDIVCESSFKTIFAASASISDHGTLSGLGDDDHQQYFNQARGDARYLGLTAAAAKLAGGNDTTQLGAIPYQSSTDTTAFLVNTTNIKKFLTQTGTGTNGAAPVYSTIAVTDVPPPGADKQISYNNAGARAGSADLVFDNTNQHLEVGLATGSGAVCLPGNVNDEVAEPNELIIYAKNIAGRLMPKWVDPSGVDTPFQSSLSMNKYMQVYSTGTAYAYIGCATRTDNGGTSTQTVMTTGSIKNQLPRVVHATGTTTNTILYSRHSSGDMSCYLGNVANSGGFFFVMRFGVQALGTGNIAFFGLSPRITPTFGANLNTYVNIIGVGYQTNSGNWQLIENSGSGTGTIIDLGATLPLNTTDAMELVLFAPPNSTTITYRVTNLTTGAKVTGTVSSRIPAVNTLLTPMTWVSNNASTTSCQIWVNKYSIETDY